VFAGLVHPDQPADPPQQILFINQRYSISLSQNQPISVQLQTSERAECQEMRELTAD
jgi:hypothetical protein